LLGTIHSMRKIFRFDIFYQNIKAIPKKVISWINFDKDHNRIPRILMRELKPKFTKALQVLTDTVGASSVGDYLDFGVCGGTSLACMFQALKEMKLNDVRLFGFDSFEGYPVIAAIDIENELQPGECDSTLSSTTGRLTENGIDWNRTFLIKGWFSDTLNGGLIQNYNIQKASIIMIDCDLYSSAKESLNFCRPLIKDISIIFFGDWHEDKCVGERRAFEEFLKENEQLKSKLFSQYRNHRVLKGRIFLVTNETKKKSVIK
jgi:O-methyltransferase